MKQETRGRKKSPQKRSAIIKSAKKLILKHGFDGTSMDAISELAAVSKKTLYSHFNDKNDLFTSVLEDYWNQSLSKMDLYLDPKIKPEQALTHFSEQLCNFLYNKNTLSLFRVLIKEHKRFPQLSFMVTDHNHAPFKSSLSEYLNHQVDIGALDIPHVDLATTQFIGMIKEVDFWPLLLGQKKSKSAKQMNLVVDTAIDSFLYYYQA